MTKEYIEREALALKVRRHLMPNVDIDGTVSVEDAERYFLKLLYEEPAADVTEVVRCKDCEYIRGPRCGMGYCYPGTVGYRVVSLDDFCKLGKRRKKKGENDG